MATLSFPKDFQWGVATAAYQIEGACDKDGKGQSIWDEFCRKEGAIKNGDNGQVACDSYHRYLDDISLLKQLGVKTYRFSISWPRIIPDPFTRKVSEAGVAFYDKLLDALTEAGICACVTLYHWDLPLGLEERLGGWASRDVIPYFLHYADICFQRFGHKVKRWVTFNEPAIFLQLGYVLGMHAPGRKDMAEQGPYVCVHNVLLAHAQAYRLYHRQYGPSQKGEVGVALNADWSGPLDPSRDSDVEAATRYRLLKLDMYAYPIFVSGDYPPDLKALIADRSEGNGSRLPDFAEEEKAMLKGSSDFFGLNYYTSRYITTPKCSGTDEVRESESEEKEPPGYKGDCHYAEKTDPEWPRGEAEWMYSVPWGLRKLLSQIQELYGDPVIYVTENGWSDAPDTLQDEGRVAYLSCHLAQVCKAITEDGVSVRGYYHWSLMDNFEWSYGYDLRFGLAHVDFKSPDRKRTPKKSFESYRRVISANAVVL